MPHTPVTYSRQFRIYKKRALKFDLIAATVVFLVAIPLCLGIAMASGAPPFAGILSGIIGGIIVGSLSGSAVSVSGPAAGMVGVVITAIAQLGDFNVFLLALLLAGLLQMLAGSLRAGFIADYIPSNVIQGMLCAIGFLLVIKELPLAFTLSADLTELKSHLLDLSESLELSPLYALSYHINNGAMLITSLSLGTLIYFEKTKIDWIKAIPGPIVVVLIGIVLNEAFVLTNSFFAQNTPQLVNIPKHDGFADFYNQMQSPTWSAWLNPKVYLYAFIIATVASLESLLNINAGEKLDKKHRRSSKDNELLAQGVGNVVAGLLGGIPITSVVVRTSVNIQAGSKTKLSAILHGVFILLAVMTIPAMLNKIPLSSLAAILIFTGYKLTKPSIYSGIYRQGTDRFIPFIATVIGVVALNLLAGILIGLTISLFFILKSNSEARLDIIKEIYPNGITHRLVLPQQTTFLNKASLIAELDAIPRNAQLIIDARYSNYIDKEIVEFIKEFKKEQAPVKQIALNLIGFQDHYAIHNYIDFINVTTYDVQSTLQPHDVLDIMHEGNQRFLNDTRIHRSLEIEIKYTATTQHPMAVVLGCIDSRVPVETVFDMSVGDLFCVRIAGNVINNDILASMEYGCHLAGAKLIVVLGHTHCGAIQAACNGVTHGHIDQLLQKIRPSVVAETKTTDNRTSANQAFVNNVTELNVATSLIHIYQKSDILRTMINEGQLGLVGAIYDVNSGEVYFKNYALLTGHLDKQSNDALPLALDKLVTASKINNQPIIP